MGQLLPSENTLIAEFDCSRNTVRRAVAGLVRDGYVQTRQGWGVCNIFQPIEPSAYTMGTIESFAETSRRTGQHSATPGGGLLPVYRRGGAGPPVWLCRWDGAVLYPAHP